MNPLSSHIFDAEKHIVTLRPPRRLRESERIRIRSTVKHEDLLLIFPFGSFLAPAMQLREGDGKQKSNSIT